MTDVRLLGISGSLRRGSFNTMLLRAAGRLLPARMTLDFLPGLADLPRFDPDFGGEFPVAVAGFRRRVAEADGLLIATPEYNRSIPGVLKDALDWASVPAPPRPLFGKPISIVSASPSQTGGVRAQYALRAALVGNRPVLVRADEVIVPCAGDAFDGGGNLTDRFAEDRLRALLEALAEAARAARGGRVRARSA